MTGLFWLVVGLLFVVPFATAHADTPSHNWGAQRDGFAVSLGLDKSQYNAGEDIKLHMACTRFTGDWSVSGGKFLIRLCEPDIEVKNTDGSPVKLTEQSNNPDGSFSMCGMAGGSSGPFETQDVKKGEVLTSEQTLNAKTCINADRGFFQDSPGTYKITAVWKARADMFGDSEDDQHDNTVIEVRSQPVTFTIR